MPLLSGLLLACRLGRLVAFDYLRLIEPTCEPKKGCETALALTRQNEGSSHRSFEATKLETIQTKDERHTMREGLSGSVRFEARYPLSRRVLCSTLLFFPSFPPHCSPGSRAEPRCVSASGGSFFLSCDMVLTTMILTAHDNINTIYTVLLLLLSVLLLYCL